MSSLGVGLAAVLLDGFGSWGDRPLVVPAVEKRNPEIVEALVGLMAKEVIKLGQHPLELLAGFPRLTRRLGSFCRFRLGRSGLGPFTRRHFKRGGDKMVSFHTSWRQRLKYLDLHCVGIHRSEKRISDGYLV